MVKISRIFSPTVATTTTTVVVIIIIVISYYFCEEFNYMSTHVCIKLIIAHRSKAEENFTCLSHLCITHNKNSVTITKFV